jgi:hypothetical protein
MFKNRDKQMTYIAVLVFSKVKWQLNCQGKQMQVCAGRAKLDRWCTSTGFVYYHKYKTVNCHMQAKGEGQTG